MSSLHNLFTMTLDETSTSEVVYKLHMLSKNIEKITNLQTSKDPINETCLSKLDFYDPNEFV